MNHARVSPTFRAGRSLLALAAALCTCGSVAVAAPGGVSLDSVEPPVHRVGDLLTLRGSNFGAFVPGLSAVRFDDGNGVVIDAMMPYVWRDDFIRIPVPVGTRIGGNAVPIPKTQLQISVIGGFGQSNTENFRVRTTLSGELTWTQKTNINNNQDNSGFLGPQAMNLARTKDADIDDANGDGFPDICDNNSNNQSNNTHPVLRINNANGTGFSAQDLEPISAGDTGDFATVVPPGGSYIGNAVQYDADFADLNNDELPEIIEANNNGNVRILVNNHNNIPGRFIEDSAAWISGSQPGSPDDVEHADINGDGFVDIGIALRFSSDGRVFLNENGTSFAPPIIIDAPNGSMHDIVFMDANNDARFDVVLVNESGNARLFLQTVGAGGPEFNGSGQSFGEDARAAVPGDFNGDGFMDIAFASDSAASVYYNDPTSPGSFNSSIALPNPAGIYYDIEAGDIDLDGDLDLIGASIIFNNQAADTIRIWENDGTSNFADETTLPDLTPYQRLSADLLDYDLDGDLDLYLTGADGQNIGFGFGRVANQFWENELAVNADLNGDGVVGPADLALILDNWGGCAAGCPYDLTGDNVVGPADLALVLDNWT